MLEKLSLVAYTMVITEIKRLDISLDEAEKIWRKMA